MNDPHFPCRLLNIPGALPDLPKVCELPYGHLSYFLPDPAAIVLPIAGLWVTRARTPGIVNAVNLMQAARLGTVSRRAPLSVRAAGATGEWLIVDGNSTAIVGCLAGWLDLPCISVA